MANREIGVIPEEQSSSSDSIKNWLKSTLRSSKKGKALPSFEYEDGAINKHSTTPKNRMLRRSSSVGENIDKILQSELTWKKGKGRRPSFESRPTSSQSYTARQELVTKQREKWLLDICDETEFRDNNWKKYGISLNVTFAFIIWIGLIFTGFMLIQKGNDLQYSVIRSLLMKRPYKNKVLYMNVNTLRMFIDASNLRTIGNVLLIFAGLVGLLVVLNYIGSLCPTVKPPEKIGRVSDKLKRGMQVIVDYPRNYLQKGKGINSVSEDEIAPFLENAESGENSKLVPV